MRSFNLVVKCHQKKKKKKKKRDRKKSCSQYLWIGWSTKKVTFDLRIESPELPDFESGKTLSPMRTA